MGIVELKVEVARLKKVILVTYLKQLAETKMNWFVLDSEIINNGQEIIDNTSVSLEELSPFVDDTFFSMEGSDFNPGGKVNDTSVLLSTASTAYTQALSKKVGFGVYSISCICHDRQSLV